MTVSYSLFIFIDLVRSRGWCLDQNRNDQNHGVVIISGFFASEDCLQACMDQENVKVTGCEWNNSGKCAYHTKPILSGGGSHDYTCWIMKFNITSSPKRRNQILDHLTN